MADAKHTPGPWTWLRNDACAHGLKGAYVRSAVLMPGGRYRELAIVSAREVGDQAVCEANARLIAAAPELLAEAKNLLALYEELGTPADELRALIARAEGRT
jgi:hypothetical protein